MKAHLFDSPGNSSLGRIFCFVILLLAFTCSSLHAAQSRNTLLIKADGGSIFTIDATDARASVEAQARAFERYRKQAQDAEDSLDEPQPRKQKEPAAETKPMSDQELTDAIKKNADFQAEQMGIMAPVKLELVDVQKETVHIVSTMQFATLKEMVGQSPMLWSHSGLYFNSMQLEKDEDSNLRLTLNTVSRGPYLKNLRQQWKLMKQNSELRIIFPGKVLTSAFPQKDDKATWVTIDAEKDERMQAALKLMESPAVITAELGGLSLDQPLNSQKLRMTMRGGADAEPDLPITEAGPGFAAEPVSVTTSTVYYFPDGAKQLKNSAIYELQTTGTTVHAKLFAPKGRTIQSVSEVKVLSAKDDKGRALAPAQENENENEQGIYRSFGGGGRDSASTQIQLQLPLPQADAQSIDEISAQAIVSSIGRWKEMSIAEVRSNSQTPTDLTAVLPGAKLTISKVGVKNNQLTMTLKVDGPPSIRQLDFKVQLAGEENFTFYASDRNMSGSAKGGTRTVQVQGYAGNLRTMPADGVTLVVRFPEELKRERVNFKLKALDLF